MTILARRPASAGRWPRCAAVCWRLVAGVLGAVASAQPSDPVRLYNEAMTREAGVRADLSNPVARDAAATKRRLRTLVGAYSDLARLFPASGVGDKALWQGGMLAADAFWQWGEAVDRATALRVLETLRTTYPVSTLTRQSQVHVKRLNDAPVPDLALARTPAHFRPAGRRPRGRDFGLAASSSQRPRLQPPDRSRHRRHQRRRQRPLPPRQRS